MSRGLWSVFIIIALIIVLYGAASWFFSGIVISSPTQSLADAQAEGDTPANFGLPEPEDVTIDASEVMLSGWYFDNPGDGDCGLLFLHGFHGTRYHALNWAPLFWERGCDILAYDHRGHGGSTAAFHTYGFYEKEDAIAALNWFAERSGLKRSQIGVFGVSYGAATALQMAPMTPDVAFIGADSAYSDLREIIGFQARQISSTLAPLLLPGALWIAELRADFDVDVVAPERTIADARMPVLLVHSLTDEYTFSTHSEDIYANSNRNRTVLHLTDWGAPHGRSIITNPVAYKQLVDDFLARYAPDYGLPPRPMTKQHWSLRTALGIGERPELVSFVGGGGKTSLMFALAAELPGRTVITTTTRIFAAQMKLAPAVVYADDLARLEELLATHGRCLVVGRVEGEKAFGVDPDLPALFLTLPNVDFVLVEADGSRMRPIKAPANHEPVIPIGTTLLVPVAGIDALDGPLDTMAHRPEKIREITNYELRITNEEQLLTKDDRLTPVGLARVVTHPLGGLKSAPAGARIIPFLNKVETEKQLSAAREAAGLMLAEPRVARVVVGALHAEEPVREVWRRVTAVILAAGESRRMGSNKLHLPWGDTTVLGRTIANVEASAVSNVLLVTGHERDKAEIIAEGIDISVVQNSDYAKGMLSSVQAAVHRLPSGVEAMLVVLGDQPMVTPDIIDTLLLAYASSPYGLIAPTFRGERGNPVLIDRRHFAELLALPPETAPRALLQRHPDDLLSVAVESDAILHDLDRPEEYERWRPKAD